MKTRTPAKRLTVTVGDLIVTAFDVVGNHVDQVVDLLRFDGLKRQTLVIVPQRSAVRFRRAFPVAR